MTIKFKLLAGAAIAMASIPSATHAGEIAGKVTDAANTVSIRAAEIRIVELGRVSTTERDGSFSFADIPAGTYTLEVSYIGAETQTQTVTVSEAGVETVNFALGSAANGNILVIGQIANQASALARKRAADGVSDVLTRDAIGQFPDQNVAESLRRLPGVNILNDQGEGRFVSVRGLDPELVSTSLNGVRLPAPESDVRSVALDVISSDIIESIEVKKSLTPDMDGDTIGASVEIETTSAFDRQNDLLTVKLEGSYNDYSGEVTPKGSIDFAARLGENVGISGGISYYKREFETDNIEADDWIDDGAIVPLELQYRDYDVERERISATLGLDFRAGDSTELYVKGIWSQFDDQEYRRRLTFDLGDFEDFGPTSFSGSAATFDDTTIVVSGDDVRQRIQVERDVKDRFERQRIRSLVAGGKSDWGDWFAEYSASWAKSTERESGSVDPAEFRQRFSDDGLIVGFDFADPRVPAYSVISDPGSFFDPAEYGLNDIEFTALSDSQDEEYTAKLDLGRRFATDTGEFTVQGGVKARFREKSYNKTVEFYEIDDYILADALGIGQTYRLADISPLPGYTEATDFFLSNASQFELVEADSQFDSAVEDYSVQEDVTAGYLLGRWDSADLRVIAGLRYEHTANDIVGNVVTLVEEDGTLPDGTTATEDTVLVSQGFFTKNYDNWLPSLNIRYEAQPDLILRVAGYRSLVRPKLSALAPRFAVEQNDDDEREGEFGNPALDPYRAWNFDASAEYYLSSNGAISAAFFYKEISDYIVDTVQESGTFNGIDFDEALIPINGDKAEVFGIELGYSQAFTGPLDGFVVQANYTYTDAEGTVFTDGDVSDPRTIPLPATSKHTANISLGYDKGPFDIRLSGTYRDRYLDELADEADFDRYVDDHFQLDLSAKFRATERVQLFYEWVNINNAKYFAYNRLGGRQNIYQYEEYNWTMKFGARVTF
ncbi:TonB-dependent receptor [Altererythrobacter sp. BO-6]|uniref:TonB-dependent receptor n=1 Tax=Altererythrobacter sp. BO-6 TaxID=2604537 RepID=UPI0013E0F6BF|nr:TonB-dependent receptor [Altererythrobacter sp. BO-6]QIG52975.1 TonB-dependent receptor [Altererythrobacter sp. BO-6]